MKSFLEVCLQMDCAKLKTLERTCVMTEYLIDNGRRIDIMLQHPQFSIPIEVKINAGDQESQCYDYHFYARNAKLVYLTKSHETKPSLWTMQSKDKGNTLEESNRQERDCGNLPVGMVGGFLQVLLQCGVEGKKENGPTMFELLPRRELQGKSGGIGIF